ncbi:hypothetical protein [Thiocapsa sp.]|uniref:hypothetical protein n=1 Tax=Thiocapsa sp. TaxID=2024551 RepID=UPI00261E8780|nr:hypothetical protein [Thiocapsa sp.]
MQLRFECHLTGADYVIQQAWLDASLPRCPLHPQGGCHFARHGTYARVSPPGTRVARWYCPEGHRTFSLLPDCLAARLSGTLAEVEAVVSAAEQAPSLEALCKQHRLDIELPGALRWVRRRVQDVHSALHRIKGILGEPFALVEPTSRRLPTTWRWSRFWWRCAGSPRRGWTRCPSRSDSRPGATRRRCAPRVQHRAGPDPPGCQA